MTNHPHDGVRPKQAICEGCGYQFGGLSVRSSTLVCPECGHASVLKLRDVPPDAKRLAGMGHWRRTAWLIGLTLGLLVVLAVVMEWVE